MFRAEAWDWFFWSLSFYWLPVEFEIGLGDVSRVGV
jgi:hypothetical protein